jgi:hypothetical protein
MDKVFPIRGFGMSTMASIPIETIRNPKPALNDLEAIQVGIDTLRSMADEAHAKYVASEGKSQDAVMCIHRLLNAIDTTIKFLSRVVAQ